MGRYIAAKPTHLLVMLQRQFRNDKIGKLVKIKMKFNLIKVSKVELLLNLTLVD